MPTIKHDLYEEITNELRNLKKVIKIKIKLYLLIFFKVTHCSGFDV